jgi:SCF-associated factor 1
VAHKFPGQLEQGYGLIADGFSSPAKQASPPLKLGLPTGTRIQSLSCGRNFTTALDQKGRVWCFNSWGRPFIYQPTAFDSTLPGNNIIQIESGWSFAAVLTASSAIYVWAPLTGDVGRAFEVKDQELDRERNQDNQGQEVKGVIQCHVFTMEEIEPVTLPPLPNLPKLRETADPLPKIIKIAAGDQFIVALTDAGHVLKLVIDGINNPDAIKELASTFKLRGIQWEYVCIFYNLCG